METTEVISIVDNLDDSEWERLDESRERASLTSEDEILDWLDFGQKGPHRVKWGVDDRGRQRYKVVEGRPAGSGVRQLAGELARPAEIEVEIDKANKVEALPKNSDINGVRVRSRKPKLIERKQKKGEILTTERIVIANTTLKVKRALLDARKAEVATEPVQPQADKKIEELEIKEETEGIQRAKEMYGETWVKAPKKVLVALGLRNQTIDKVRSGEIK